MEQAYRAADVTLAHKCRAMGAPEKLKFFERIAWLADQKALSPQGLDDWHNIHKFRNFASHPERPMIVTPGHAITLMEWVADQINGLFAP